MSLVNSIKAISQILLMFFIMLHCFFVVFLAGLSLSSALMYQVYLTIGIVIFYVSLKTSDKEATE